MAAGAIIGSAIAAHDYYGSGYYYGYPAGGYYQPPYGYYGHAYAPAYGYATAAYAPGYGYGYGDTYAHPYGYVAPVRPYVGYRVRHYVQHY